MNAHEVPQRVSMVRLKHAAKINMGQSPSSEECNLEGLGVPFLQGCAEFGDQSPTPKQFCSSPPKLANAGDLLLSVRAPVGAMNRADRQYGIGRGLCAITGTAAEPEFLKFALQCRIPQLWSVATGSTYEAVSVEQVANLRIPLPALPEQAAIAAFLKRETGRIDALVEQQRRLIGLLKEKRQAIISNAVTKGLNPNARMKDTGIDWLGEVPEHWEVKRLCHLAKPRTSITYGIVQAGPDIEGGIPYIRTSDMSGDTLPLEGYLRTSDEIDGAYARSRVEPGDVVIAIRATIGKPLIVPAALERANLTQGTAKFSPGEAISAQYVCHFLRSNGAVVEFGRLGKGATFKEITLEMLRNFPILCPPISEQIDICRRLASQTSKLDALISEGSRATELLNERRAALISAAVTGKIDVRDAEATPGNLVADAREAVFA